MGIISMDYVISYSSQDRTYRAENLLQSPGNGKSWLCAPDDKTGRLEAEFQLQKASTINFIDIGNHGSATVEIQVGRSSFGCKTKYVSFLPAVTLLSLADLKENGDRNAVYMFNKNNISEAAATEKWDRIKVICCQPYRKNTQFGLSFLSLRADDLVTQLSISDQNERSPFKRSAEFRPDFTFTRGKQLLKASRSKIIAQEKEKPNPSTLEEDISVFLIACLSEDNENKSLEEYMKEFEEQSQQTLSNADKNIFGNKYLEISHGNTLTSEYHQDSSISREQDSRSESYLFSPINGTREPEVPSFDLQLPIPLKRKSDVDETENMKKAFKRLKTSSKPTKVAEILKVSPEDFIQFDGVQPSTSSGVTYVECPICRESFPSQEIERHASACGDLTADVEYLYSSKPNALLSEEREDSFITCLFCEELYPEGVMSSHMDLCVQK